jgi:thioredoxin 1
MVKVVTQLSEYKKLLMDNKKVMVDFFADWCGPCQKIGPVFSKMSENSQYKDILCIKVNVDDAEEIAVYENINSMPTFKAYLLNKPMKTIVGANESSLTSVFNDLNNSA